MSVAFVDTPALFQPVLSDGIFFTVSSSTYNATSTFKFRYVYELFINGQLEFAGKCTPNPFGLGIIDLQQVLESYTSSLPISYFNGTPIYTHQTPVFSVPAGDSSIYFDVKVGYEYASTELAPITGFTGVGNNIGDPEYTSEGYKVFRSTMGTNGRATQQDFDTGPFILSGAPNNIYPTTSGLFLTNAPRIQDISPDFYYTLSFTNYYTASGQTPTYLSEPYYVEYTFLDDQGAVISARTYDNILTNGGGPRTNCNDVYPALYLLDPWSGTTYDILNVAAGPKNIPDFPENCAQYTVQLFGKFTGTTSPIVPSPTPTRTPKPTTTEFILTPTPSPSSACGDCKEYTVEYTGGSSSTIVSYTNCTTGAVQQVLMYSTVIYVICSCTIPTGSDLDIVELGPCLVTPTPTPTVTSTPSGCVCIEYEIESEVPYSTGVSYEDCDGNNQSFTLGAFQRTVICACEDSVIAEGGVLVNALGDCTFTTPTPTPTPSNTPPVPTPSSTQPAASPTPTSTPNPGYAYYYLVRDCDDPAETRCFASNTFYPSGRVVKASLIVGCWEILDFCSAPEDDVITLSYLSCEVCPR